MGPPATPPGFIDGKLQESCPFNTDEAAVYASLCRLVPPAAYGRADFVLKLACVRGYHKEKPRAETTAAELTRILEWREKSRMDEVRGGQNTDRVAGGEGKRRGSRSPSVFLDVRWSQPDTAPGAAAHAGMWWALPRLCGEALLPAAAAPGLPGSHAAVSVTAPDARLVAHHSCCSARCLKRTSSTSTGPRRCTGRTPTGTSSS